MTRASGRRRRRSSPSSGREPGGRGSRSRRRCPRALAADRGVPPRPQAGRGRPAVRPPGEPALTRPRGSWRRAPEPVLTAIGIASDADRRAAGGAARTAAPLARCARPGSWASRPTWTAAPAAQGRCTGRPSPAAAIIASRASRSATWPAVGTRPRRHQPGPSEPGRAADRGLASHPPAVGEPSRSGSPAGGDPLTTFVRVTAQAGRRAAITADAGRPRRLAQVRARGRQRQGAFNYAINQGHEFFPGVPPRGVPRRGHRARRAPGPGAFQVHSRRPASPQSGPRQPASTTDPPAGSTTPDRPAGPGRRR